MMRFLRNERYSSTALSTGRRALCFVQLVDWNLAIPVHGLWRSCHQWRASVVAGGSVRAKPLRLRGSAEETPPSSSWRKISANEALQFSSYAPKIMD